MRGPIGALSVPMGPLTAVRATQHAATLSRVDYTLVQARAELDTVLGAFAAHAPGRELTEVANERGWTTARLDPRIAIGFAAKLASRIGSAVLVVTVDERLRASLATATGEIVETADELRAAFLRDHPGPSDVDATTAGPDDPPRRQHVALAARLGVPAAVPGTLEPVVAIPSARGEREFRRTRRIIVCRSWLLLATGLLLVAAIPAAVRGYLIPTGGLLASAGLLWVVRFAIGRHLPRYIRDGTRRT